LAIFVSFSGLAAKYSEIKLKYCLLSVPVAKKTAPTVNIYISQVEPIF